MKYEIAKPLDMSWNDFGKLLETVQEETWKISNEVIQMYWEWDGFGKEYKTKAGDFPTKKDMQEWTGYSGIDGYMYNILKAKYPAMNRGNMTQTIQFASKRWKEDRKEVAGGRMSVPSFKKTIPIALNPNNIKIYQEGNYYTAQISLASADALKEFGRKNGGIPMGLRARDSQRKAILNKIISGQYKVAGSKIHRDRRTRKWMFLLTYSFEVEETPVRDGVMGIDLGIAIPVYMAFHHTKARYRVEGGEIEQFRRGIEARRKSIQRQVKYCGGGRKGHGRNTALKPLETMSNKVSNFRDTWNHKVSKYVVDMAVKHNCFRIQMEDLSGISEDKGRFLQNWSYFDLQQKITYKAEEKGIEVLKIDPRYTSQRCSECGYIAKSNRKGQPRFVCGECGYEENADYNAARNIAEVGIADIIKEQLKRQKEEKKDEKPVMKRTRFSKNTTEYKGLFG